MTQDYIDIQQLYARYAHAVDYGDIEGFVALFAPDGSFGNFVGHDGLRTFMKNRPKSGRRHWNSNVMITGTPEGANGSAYLLIVDVDNSSLVIEAGKYEDTFVKTAQGWRFKRRVVHFERRPERPPSAAR